MPGRARGATCAPPAVREPLTKNVIRWLILRTRVQGVVAVGRGRRRAAALLTALALVPVGPAAAAQPATSGAGQRGAVLKVGIQQDIDSLNPFLGFSLAATDLFRAIYPTLTTYGADDFHPEGELADGWQVSPDRLTWTFHIRPGVRWSDGQPVTAGDAAYTYNRMMTDPAASTANGSFVEKFDAVSAPDPSTLVIRTKTPQATMLAIDAPIVPEHVWNRIADVGNFTNTRMPVVGSGPFVLTGYEPQQRVTLRANPDYWRGPPKVAGMQFVTFKNSDAAVQALRKGEIDVAQKLTPTQFAALAHAPNVERVRGQGRRFYELLLNPGATNSRNEPIGTGNPALRDLRVRQAIDHAIDRDALVDRVLNGDGQRGDGYVPPIFGRYHWSPPQPPHRDPAAADRELDAAGYRRGPDGVRRTPGGAPLTLRMMLHSDDSSDARVGEFVKQWLADLGIGVQLESVSDNQVNQRTTGGDFDMAVSGYSANPDPDYVLRLQTCGARPSPDGGGQPDSFLCDPVYDAAYQRQLGDFDPAQWVADVKQAEQRFYEQKTGLVLFYKDSLEAYRSDRFRRFTPQPADHGVITAQQGVWGYYQAEPTPVAMRASTGEGYERAAWSIFVVVLAGGAVIALVALRRRATRDRRE